MLKKLTQYFMFFRKINTLQFFYFNYFSKKIVRMGKGKLIPYKHAVIELNEGARVYLNEADIEIGCDRPKHSKTETIVRLLKNAVWTEMEGCKISYGCTVEILQDAELNSRYFTMNCNSVIVAAHKICLGHDVMIGRNVIIYDSDFHQILDSDNEVINPSKEVLIGDHVWLGVNTTILKGSIVVSEQMQVYQGVSQRTLCIGMKDSAVKKEILPDGAELFRKADRDKCTYPKSELYMRRIRICIRLFMFCFSH